MNDMFEQALRRPLRRLSKACDLGLVGFSFLSRLLRMSLLARLNVGLCTFTLVYVPVCLPFPNMNTDIDVR